MLRFVLFFSLSCGAALSCAASETEIDYKLALEQRQFFHAGSAEQLKSQSSLQFEPQFIWYPSAGNSQLKGHIFARYDHQDEARRQLDVRELLWTSYRDEDEIRIGIGKVFWGVAESIHLVDVINQTDMAGSPDGTEKLGQPMVHYSRVLDNGLMEMFLLPYFRVRNFPESGVGSDLRYRYLRIIESNLVLDDSWIGLFV